MKLFALREFARGLCVTVLAVSLSAPPSFSAQTHVVTPAELQSALTAARETREKHLAAVHSLFSSAPAARALRVAQIDSERVKTATASLSDEELSRLASRADLVQADIAAGRLSDRDLILILIGLAALILIIVAVD